MTPALANASVTFGTVQKIWRKSGGDAVGYLLDLPTAAHAHYGAPASVYVEITSSADAASAADLNITLRWQNKTTTRLPESIWLEMRPDAGTDAALSVSKMGSPIDPNDVVA